MTSSRPASPPAAPSHVSRVDDVLRWIGHQRWLRYGVRDRLLRALRNPERRLELAFEVPFASAVYPGTMSRWIDWIVYYYGAYELDELELARALMAPKRKPIALDIGANVGHHTLYFASFCSAVHAFEPYEPVGRHIDEKVKRNALQNVVVHRVGLSDADQELEYYAPQGSNTGTGTFVATHETANNQAAGKLRLVQGDAYIDSLALDSVDLVKIDVEGFEIPVVRGLRRTLAHYRPVIMMELSDSARADFASLEDFMALFPTGYQAEIIRSQRHRLMFLGQPGCAMEPLRFDGVPTRGGYVNLLLRPAMGGTTRGDGAGTGASGAWK